MRVVFLICVWCLTLAGAFDDQFYNCPTISEGFPPYCKCRYGPAYDNATKSCPNPECPTASVSEPSYPNCTCTEKNFGYSAYLNECFRVCPEGSNGYWPKCICDDKLAGFDKKNFKCIRCPEDSEKGNIYPNCNCKKVGLYDEIYNECKKCVNGTTGIYPNCKCIEKAAVYNEYRNACETCPPESTGEIPNCVCKNGADYITFANFCVQCPYGATGEYGKCECSDGGYYEENQCKYCPWGSNGTYPNCICESSLLYVKDKNSCFECPSNSTGTYPSCECEEPLQYDVKDNLCYQCPQNAIGIYPDCECNNGLYANESNVCLVCPVNTTGNYPDCECAGEDHVYSSYINQCYIECGEDSVGLHPYCKCQMPRTYYKPEEFSCKSIVGRECPPASIGIGPDCLCAETNRTFVENLWGCYYSDATYAHYAPTTCPNKSQKWPQCSGIDRNALLSLVG